MRFLLLELVINYLKSVESRTLNIDFVFLYHRLLCERLKYEKNKTLHKKETKADFKILYPTNFRSLHVNFNSGNRIITSSNLRKMSRF